MAREEDTVREEDMVREEDTRQADTGAAGAASLDIPRAIILLAVKEKVIMTPT